MMENILFDSKGADKLNNMIQSQIASHLFVICNYNPNSFELIGCDAKFFQGIVNLYKFAIDTSLINRIKRMDKDLGGSIATESNQRMIELQQLLDIINCLRTYTSHNNFNNDVIKKTEEWLHKVIQKKQFENIRDYDMALKKLDQMGDRLVCITREIIEAMVEKYPNQELCDAFQAQIKLFYETRQRLIKDELRSAIKSMIPTQIVTDGIVANWCKKKYLEKTEEKIKSLRRYLPQSRGEQKKKLEEKIDQYETECMNICKMVAEKSEKCKGNTALLQDYDFYEYYCGCIGQRIDDVLPSIKKKNLSMLPQDMLQLIFQEDFSHVCHV